MHIKKTGIFIGIIIVACCFLGVGYASITGVDLTLEGDASMEGQTGVVISNIVLSDSHATNPNFSKINTYYQTLLDSQVVLGNDLASYVTYTITITNLTDKKQVFKGIEYDPSYYDNTDIIYELTGLNVDDYITAGQTATVQLKFKYDPNLQTITEDTLNSIINFKFQEESGVIMEKTYPGLCNFNGEGNDITGDCVGPDEHVDYLDTGIALFSDENYSKDFEIGFNIVSFDSSRFVTAQRDTIFNNLYDNSPFPGVTFRVQNKKWFLQAGNGTSNQKKELGTDIQSFKIIRRNGYIYYKINDGDETYYTDLNSFPNTFNQTLTFGVSINTDGTPRTERYLQATLSDMYVRLTEPKDPSDYFEIDQMINEFVGVELTNAYQLDSHVYNGTTDTANTTGLALFDQTNYQKSWVATFELDDVDISGQVAAQASLFNVKEELVSPYKGLVLRKQSASDTKYTLNLRKSATEVSTVSIPKSAKRINIIKKGMDFYYQFNHNDIRPIGTDNSFAGMTIDECFPTEATFGSIKYDSGNYDRVIVGTLSKMSIRMSS